VLALWRINRDDGIVAATVFVLALLTKPDYALLIGVMISLMFFLWKTMHPRVVRVTKDPERDFFVNADRYEKPCCPQIMQLRPEHCMYFANAEYTREHILELVDGQNSSVKFLLLDFEAVGFIDITGIDELCVLHDELKARGVKLALMRVHLPVKELFKSSHIISKMKSFHLIENKRDAIAFVFQHTDHGYCKNVCPHELFLSARP
jgi:SulP family sulfate permease